MPSIRATVTTDEAAPNAPLPAASTAAVERGVTDSPNPSPKAASASDASPTVVDAVQRDIASSPPTAAARPISVTRR